VINYDLPQDCEDYVHRIGRTARAGAEGKAISLVDEDGAFFLEAIEEYIKTKIPTEWADDELYVLDYVRTARPKRVQDIKRDKPGVSRGSDRNRRPAASQHKKATLAVAKPTVAAPSSEVEGRKKPRRRKKKTNPTGDQTS